MRQNKKKHAVLIVLLILIAIVSVQYMTEKNYRDKSCKMTLVLPKTTQQDLSSVQEGIRDYAYQHQVRFDVWYETQMSKTELENRIKEAQKNQSVGVLLVYPEDYLEETKKGYHYEEVMALTDTMQDSFSYYAGFAKTKEETCRLPVDETVLEQIKNGEKEEIKLENTYRLGYESVQMLAEHGKKKQMKSIILKPVKLDKKALEDGSLDALFAE